MDNVPISFPGLHLSFNVSPDAFTVGNFSIRWYGILIAVGLLLAMLYGLKRAKDWNITTDDLSDVIIFSIIFGIIGARLYYIIFDPSRSSDFVTWKDYFSIWNGGLGIYGGIIAAFITALVVCKIKRISTGAVFDIAALGFLIGQAIGRWGNFFNREAYGAITKLPWRMVLDSTGNGYQPCFFYESMWCILGFVLLHIYSKRRKFNGEVFLLYVMWYGLGRFFIEGLRLDSLMIGTMRVSQLVALFSFVVALVLLIIRRRQLREAKTENQYQSLYDDAAAAVKKVDEEIDDEYLDEDDEPDGEEENGKDGPERNTEAAAEGEAENRAPDRPDAYDPDKPDDQKEDH